MIDSSFRHMIGMLIVDPDNEDVIVFAGKELGTGSARELKKETEAAQTGFVFFTTDKTSQDEFGVWARGNLHKTMTIDFHRSDENEEVTFSSDSGEFVTFTNLLTETQP